MKTKSKIILFSATLFLSNCVAHEPSESEDQSNTEENQKPASYSLMTYNQIDYQNNVLSERIGEHVRNLENILQNTSRTNITWPYKHKQEIILNKTKETLNNLTAAMKRLMRITKTGFVFDTIIGGPNVLAIAIGARGLDTVLTFKEGEVCLNYLEVLANNIVNLMYLEVDPNVFEQNAYYGTYTRPLTYDDFDAISDKDKGADENPLPLMDERKKQKLKHMLKTLLVPINYENGNSFVETLFSNQPALTVLENLNLLKHRVFSACEIALSELETEIKF